MPSVPARFRVGFASSAEYAQLTDANKTDFKNEVETEIKAHITEADLASWNGLTILVNANGHKDETAIQDDIVSHLGALSGSPNITIDPQAGVRYAIWDNTRICIHEYFLNRGASDWEVAKTYTDQTPNPLRVEVQLYGSLEWDTPL